MMIKRATEVNLVGRGKVTLSANDHVATGGEGSIYRKARTVVKLYTDTGKMHRDGMPDKLGHLAKLKHGFIVAPTNLVTDLRDSPIGYYMPYANGEPLSRVFTNDFRAREGFADKDATQLAARMREVVEFAHGKDVFMVDANELNWVVVLKGKQGGPEPRALDVDSWVIKGKIPSKIAKMPSIRDWHNHVVSLASDWFAWGIVTFQVFTGIHPYKGKLGGYRPRDLEKRMQANASVFTPGVRLNRAVRDFSCIPGPLFDWYQAAFQQGERGVPPSPLDTGAAKSTAAQVARMVVTTSGMLVYDKLFDGSSDPVIRIFPCGVVLQKSGRLTDLATKRAIGTATSPACEVTKQKGGWLIADLDGNKELVFVYVNSTSLQQKRLTLTLKGYRLLRYGDRMFVVTDRGLTEVKLTVLGSPVLSVDNTWGVMINSTRWFDGVGIQDAMGATFVIAPFGDKACGQVRVKELDGLKPVEARAGNRYIAIMTVDKDGEYQRIDLVFDRDYKSYTVATERSDTPDLNVAMLPKGVAASIVEDGELQILVPTQGKLNKVSDRKVTTDMILGNWENKVVYTHDGDVWSVRTA